jgi:anti-anti-sigma factor
MRFVAINTDDKSSANVPDQSKITFLIMGFKHDGKFARPAARCEACPPRSGFARAKRFLAFPAFQAAHEGLCNSPMQVEKIDIQGVPTLKIRGEIDLHASPELRQSLRESLAQKPRHLLLDMSEVEYMDSSGLGVLIEYMKESQSFGGKLGLFGLREKVQSILRLVGLDRFFVIEGNAEKTLARLGN